MAIYKCLACGNEYDEELEGEKWENLSDDWACPICGVDQSFFEKQGGEEKEIETKSTIVEEVSIPKKTSDKHEENFADIHQMAETGMSASEPMKTTRPVISWNEILIKGAQLAKLPLNSNDSVKMKTVIGVDAKQPLIIESPVYISHMSFGALSKEMKIALAKGSADVKTLICSGEGGILPEEQESSYKYIYEYIPNQYSLTDENLRKVDAVEIKIGQSAKPGMGGHLPGIKVTDEIAEVRGKTVGEDIYSPANYIDIKTKEQLKDKVDWLREKTEGKPIGVKIAAGNIEADLDVIIYAKPDFITIDGRGGATGSAPKYIKDNTSVPTIFALDRARKYLDAKGIKNISLVITGGLRVSSDYAKALALGADAVAIATAAMMAGGCQQFRVCDSGNCPMGIATQDTELRKRLNVDVAAQRIGDFLRASNVELQNFARITGNDDIHHLSIADLCTSNYDLARSSGIEYVGGGSL